MWQVGYGASLDKLPHHPYKRSEALKGCGNLGGLSKIAGDIASCLGVAKDAALNALGMKWYKKL